MNVDTVAEQLLFTTVRIDTKESGCEGSGTGFIFSHLLGDAGDKEAQFIVTNKHVIADAVDVGVTFINAKNSLPDLGNACRVDFENHTNLWHPHPDPAIDIAVAPLLPILTYLKSLDRSIFYRSIPTSLIPNRDQLTEFDALEDVIFVGYPDGIWDSSNHTPIIRKGITATPIQIDFEDRPEFLVDASVFGGSSGSPVFTYSSGIRTTRVGGTSIGGRHVTFVGVISSVFFRNEFSEIVSVPIPTMTKQYGVGKEMIDLGIVIKSSCIPIAIENAIQTLQRA